MERRPRRRRPAPRGPVDAVWRALANDGTLVARVGAALAGTTAAGVVGAFGIAVLHGVFVNFWLRVFNGALLGALLGLGLAALAIAGRRRVDRIARARRELAIALALGGLAIAATVALAARRPPLVGVPLGLLLGLASAIVGYGVALLTGRALLRAAMNRRAAFYARLRASRLTRRMLGAADYRTLRREGALPVRSTLYPRRTYLVPLRTTPAGARILVLEDGRPVGGLCLRPREPLPDPEEALAHILAIRSDERAWLERANFFPQDRELTPQARGLAPGRPGNYDR